MNRLNIFYEHIFEAAAQTGLSVEEILIKARGFGYEGLECDLWRLSDRNGQKALFSRCGMRAASVYNMFDFPHDPREKSLEKIGECLDTAAFFGAKQVLAVPGFIRAEDDKNEVLEKICGLLSVMCERAKPLGITVTLEDFDDSAAPYSTIAGLEFFLKNVDGLGFTFDTGNFAYSLESAEEAYLRLRPYVKHVHLKDRSWDASRADKSCANAKPTLSGEVMYPCEVGGGFISIAGLIRRLIADGYDGALSVEHFGAVDQLGYMERSAKFVQSVFLERGERSEQND